MVKNSGMVVKDNQRQQHNMSKNSLKKPLKNRSQKTTTMEASAAPAALAKACPSWHFQLLFILASLPTSSNLYILTRFYVPTVPLLHPTSLISWSRNYIGLIISFWKARVVLVIVATTISALFPHTASSKNINSTQPNVEVWCSSSEELLLHGSGQSPTSLTIIPQQPDQHFR